MKPIYLRQPCMLAVIPMTALILGGPSTALAWPQQPVPAAPGNAAAAPARSAALLAILDEHVDWSMRESPVTASTRGDLRFNNLLRDESPAATARRLEAIKDRLARLRALDRSTFTPADALDADLLIYELALDVERADLHEEQMPVESLNGPQIWLPQLGERVPMRTEQHRLDWVARLEAIPEHLAQITEQMRLGMAAGRVPPKVVMGHAVAAAESQADPSVIADPAKSPFFSPLRGLPENDPIALRAKKAIAQGIVPAFQKFHAFLRDEYTPACRDTIGYAKGVDGPRAYDLALRSHTTLNLTAPEIHAIGLREVARLRAEMIALIPETEFPQKAELTGDALLAAFLAWCRSEPSFYYTEPEAKIRDYRAMCKVIDAEMPRLFATLPRNPYGVREIPRFAAISSPTAYYYPGSLKGGVAGFFMVNTYRLDQRPKYSMLALAIHEAVPGHHLQVALASELEGQHEFRTLTSYTAYVEGWALYSERLGLEMGPNPRNANGTGGRGLYAQPMDEFGRLSFEMWRACRLVVDTGMHALDWDRQRAIDFMLANTALAQVDIEREIDRYISMPGQACAYKLGQLKILELRAKAEKALGEKFDIRRFHDAILLTGAVPLPVLEAHVERWIVAEASRP
jgi:uncharacterized protein (DUF885 family)